MVRSVSSSGYRGISWHKRRRKWQVLHWYAGKVIHGGDYATIEEALKARNELWRKYPNGNTPRVG